MPEFGDDPHGERQIISLDQVFSKLKELYEQRAINSGYKYLRINLGDTLKCPKDNINLRSIGYEINSKEINYLICPKCFIFQIAHLRIINPEETYFNQEIRGYEPHRWIDNFRLVRRRTKIFNLDGFIKQFNEGKIEMYPEHQKILIKTLKDKGIGPLKLLNISLESFL